ncbi:MAG: ABC transporter ATP-binding protein [Chloroflexota bacterium]
MPFLEVSDVCYTYPGANSVEALRNLTFGVEQNQFVSVIGPSGSGKSTLLRLISDLLAPTTGRVSIQGQPSQAARQRREIGFVFQEPALMPWRSAMKNVRLPLEVMKKNGDSGRQTAESLLNLVGLKDFQRQRPEELSGGMRQRVSIARALTYDPPLLLMDEPFGALDQITRDEMGHELLNIWTQRQSTVVFVTHSIAEAIYLSDRVIVLSSRPGTIVDVIDVPLARPRELEMRRSPAFVQTEGRLLGALEGRAATHG